jgi:hypothetical protein
MIKITKLSLNAKGFHGPTPAKWRKIGLALAGAAGFISANIALFADFEYKSAVIWTFLALGGLGKLITEFVHED